MVHKSKYSYLYDKLKMITALVLLWYEGLIMGGLKHLIQSAVTARCKEKLAKSTELPA